MAKFKNALLNVDGMKISSNELSYDNLVWLYKEYIKNNGEVPTTKNCNLANNLPSPRIVMKILEKTILHIKILFFNLVNHKR